MRWLKKPLCRFGHTRGKQIRQKVEDLGLETGLDNFLRFGDFSDVGRSGVSYEIRQCSLEEQIQDAYKVELSLILCEMDRAMLCGYNPELAPTHSGCLRLGSNSCHFVSKVHSA